jgi:hypothetical protein
MNTLSKGHIFLQEFHYMLYLFTYVLLLLLYVITVECTPSFITISITSDNFGHQARVNTFCFNAAGRVSESQQCGSFSSFSYKLYWWAFFGLENKLSVWAWQICHHKCLCKEELPYDWMHTYLLNSLWHLWFFGSVTSYVVTGW